MKFASPAQAMPLNEVPIAGIFGCLEYGNYTRFIRLSDQNTNGILAVSLAPSIDRELTGPSVIFLDADLTVYFEIDTIICPKTTVSDGIVIEPRRNNHIPVGAFVLGNDGAFYLYARTGRGARSLVNLATGEIKTNPSNSAFYEHYLLLAKNELGKQRVIFDSAKEEAARAAA